MKTRSLGLIRISLALCLLGAGAAASAQISDQQQPLPDSPSAVAPQKAGEAQPFEGQASSAISSWQSSPTQSQTSPTQKPVGTAAAETPATTGVAASNPAGAAIAPAKQRRARELLISRSPSSEQV